MMIDLQSFKRIIIICCFLVVALVKAKPDFCHHPKHEKSGLEVACDLCGCSTTSGSFGFGTLNNANFVGLRYINQTFKSKNGIFNDSPISTETINTYQLWAQIPVKKVFMLSLNLPYQDLNRKFKGVSENLNGFGDASAIAWYKHVFYKKVKEKDTINFNETKTPTGHSLQFGIGAKAPTGKFEQRLADNINPGFQVGTGSFDGIFSLGYNYGSDNVGVNTLATYYLKGENKNDYQFGNQLSLSTNVFTLIKTKKGNIMPFLGMSFDNFDKIIQYNETIAETDGNITNATIGSEFVMKRFIIGANYTKPISQNLFGGNVESQQRFSIYVNLAL